MKKKNQPKYKEQMRTNHLKKHYGITSEDYDRMLFAQNEVCVICNLPEINKRLAVDHSHKTGKVRGLLCSSCNARLGVVEDEKFVKKAKQYLRRYPD